VIKESDFKRKEFLPSEKAFVYKMELNIIKNQEEKKYGSAPKERVLFDRVAARHGITRSVLHNYIKLTNLIPVFLDKLDAYAIPFLTAVQIAEMKSDEQEILYNMGIMPTWEQAVKLSALSFAGRLTEEIMKSELT